MGSEESKLSILKAAVKAFSTKGFDSVSIRDVAKDAGVNHAIIRYHFGSKNDLWLAVYQHLMIGMTTLRDSQPFNHDSDDIKTEFKAWVRSRVAFISQNPELLKIILLEIIEGSPRFEQIDTLMRMFAQGSIAIIERMQELDIVVNFNMKDMFFIMPSFIGGRFLYPNFDKDFDGNPIDIEDVIDAHTELMMNLVFKDN